MSQSFPFAKIVAHRGAPAYAPENTLISMQKAYDLGAKFVEFDVMLTADQTPIIMHDITLDRTTSGKGEVASTTYKDAANLDAGSWFGKDYAGEKVPTFSAMLDLLAKLKMQINVEIKPAPGVEVATAEHTMQLLEKKWYPTGLPLIVSSASIISLRTVRAMDQQVLLGYITDIWPADWEQILDEVKAASMHVCYQALTPERIAALKKTGRWLLSYTVNDAELATRLFAWGVDAIFTDYPDKMLKLSL